MWQVSSQTKPEHVTPTLVGGAAGQPTVMDKQYKPNHLGGLRRFALAITVFTLLGHFSFGFEQSYAQPLASLATAYVAQLLPGGLCGGPGLSIVGRASPAASAPW